MKSSRRIRINNKEVSYRLSKRKGTRSVKLSVYQDGLLSVSAPKWYPIYLIEKFIQEKGEWILKNITGTDFSFQESQSRKDYLEKKEGARKIIESRVEFFNRFYGFDFGRISIRNQRTCWGSCSQNKNLNFNYKVSMLPEELRDYVIVHELCHLQELNHSQRFWNLVSKQIPEFQDKRKALRKIKF